MSLVLLWSLLTLCVCAGTPKVWVQVQMVATELPSFTVHCGFLGSGFISLVTMSWWGPNVTKGTKLAVLHPEFRVRQWAPARQAHWLNESSVSLTLERVEVQSPQTNTTFCCEFVSFPDGSHEACGDPLASSEQGLPAPTPAPTLRADLAGILGASGVLLLGFIFVLHFLRRWRHWSVTKLQCHPLASVQAQVVCAPQASTPVPAPSSFVYTENGLYAGAGARPPYTSPSLAPSDHMKAMDMTVSLGVRQHRLPD
ncbi:transmembrane protein PVRIG [Erethizon dorsatum]